MAERVRTSVDETPEPAVQQPKTEAERRQERLDQAKSETEEQRTQRRNDEQAKLINVHQLNLAEGQRKYPVRDGVPFEELTAPEQANWNLRRRDTDQANKAYRNAVVRLVAEFADEDAYLAQERAKAAQG